MMDVCFSNRTEQLLGALCARLARARRSKPSPLVPDAIVIPNRSLESYLKLGIAEKLGIAAGLRFSTLESFAAEMASTARPDLRVADRRVITLLLIEQLGRTEVLERPELAPVLHYLGPEGEGRALRTYQLGAELAHLYCEYEQHRPEMQAAWLRRGLLRPGSELEAWQRSLWLELFSAPAVERRLAATKRRWLPLTMAFSSIPPTELVLPEQVYLFGFSYLMPGFVPILARLGERTQLHVFALNPCQEFWEDVSNRQLDLFSAMEPADPAPLRLWGRPAREHVRALLELTEGEFEGRFHPCEGSPPGVLGQIHDDLLMRRPERSKPSEDAREASDESVTILACPSVRRELEIIASEIWSLLERDEAVASPSRNSAPSPLRSTDIALLLPPSQEDAYRALIGTVFSESYDLPFTFVEGPAAGQSRLGEAIELLLALPLGRFSRKEVLRLLLHPAVVAKWGPIEPEAWTRWCEGVGIVDGASRSDHEGTYIKEDVLNWDQGLRRLALGTMMGGRQSHAPHPFSLGEEHYLPEEVAQSEWESAMTFARLVRSLKADVERARGAQRTVSEWMRLFREFISTYLGAPTERDQALLQRCLRMLAEIETPGVDVRVPYPLASEIVRQALGTLASSGSEAASGVVVAPLCAMRALPYRVIFVAGLAEGRFPSAERTLPLDLRALEPRASDLRAREQDGCAFLETLLCARHRLYLSYVCRDALTGHPIEPSSFVRALESMLERSYLGAARMQARVRQAPLHRHEDPATRSRAGEGERRAWALGKELRAAARRPRLDLDTLSRELSPETWSRLAPLLGTVSVPTEARRARPASREVALSSSQLRKFLECPLQASARALVGLRPDDAEPEESAEWERFATPPRDEVPLLKEVFARVLLESGAAPGSSGFACALEQQYEVHAERARLESRGPVGPFWAAQRRDHLRILGNWALGVARLGDQATKGANVLYFGKASSRDSKPELLDPLFVSVERRGRAGGVEPVRVELHGKTELVLGQGAGSLILVGRLPDSGWERQMRVRREGLRAFLDSLFLSASGRGLGGSYAGWICFGAGAVETPTRIEFSSLPDEEAKAHLRALTAELLGQVHDYLLPCEAIFELEHAGPKRSLAEIVVALRESRRPYSSRFGPVPHPERYQPPDDGAGRAMALRRFGPYLRGSVA